MVTDLVMSQIHNSELFQITGRNDLSSNISDLIFLNIKVFKVMTEFGDSQRHYIVDIVILQEKLFEVFEVVTFEQIPEAFITNFVVV